MYKLFLGTNGIYEQFQLERERFFNIMEDESIGLFAKCHEFGKFGATYRMMNVFGGKEVLMGIFISPFVGCFILPYFETEIDALVHYQIAVLKKFQLIISSFFT